MRPRRALPAGIRGRGSVFTYTWRDAANRQFSRKAGNTLKQAEAFKRRIDDQLALGTYAPASTMTFAAYATGWIQTWPLKDQTRECYRGILRRELLPEFGGYPLAKIHPHHVREWVARQVAGPLSASSVRQHIAVLRSCLKAAQIVGHLGDLPLLGVKMPRSHSRQPAVMTLTEAFAMIDTAPADWQCAIATALFTGLRLGELLALTLEDVDLPGRRLNIRATLTEVNSRTPRLKREEPKSRAGYRQVPIVEALAVRLEAHLSTLGPNDEAAVSASPVGTWMSKRATSTVTPGAPPAPQPTARTSPSTTFAIPPRVCFLRTPAPSLPSSSSSSGTARSRTPSTSTATSSPDGSRGLARPSTPLSLPRRGRPRLSGRRTGRS